MVRLLAQGAPEIIIASNNQPRFSHEQNFSADGAKASQRANPAARPVTPPTVPPRGFRGEEPKDLIPPIVIHYSPTNQRQRVLPPAGSSVSAVTAMAGGRGVAVATTSRTAVSIPSPSRTPRGVSALPSGDDRSLSPTSAGRPSDLPNHRGVACARTKLTPKATTKTLRDC